MHDETTPSVAPSAPGAQKQAKEQSDSFCFRCGTRLRAGGCFCSHCGCSIVEDKDDDGEAHTAEPLTPPPSPTVESLPELPHEDVKNEGGSQESTEPDGPDRRCPMCKAALPQSARYCLACGTDVVSGEQRLMLVRLSEKGPKQVAALDSDELRLGKDEQCQVRLQNDGYASRVHATIKRSGGQLTVEDLGSSNGTYIRLRRPFALEAGDVIVIGTSTFRVDPAV